MSAARPALPGLWGVPQAFRARSPWPVPGAVPLPWRRDAEADVPADAGPAARREAVLADGRRARPRAALAADADGLGRFLESLSLDARYHRFHAPVRHFAPAQLRRMVTNDARQSVVVAEASSVMADGAPGGSDVALVAELRWVLDDGRDDRAEFALVVADAWQRAGLGRQLLEGLIEEAARRGLRQLHGDVLHDNTAMAALLRRVGGHFEPSGDPRVRRAVIDLRPLRDGAPR